MAVEFPTSPTAGTEYTYNDKTWVYSGSYWELYGGVGTNGATGATGSQGATGATGTLGLGSANQIIYHDGSSLTGTSLLTFSSSAGLGTTGNITFLPNSEYIRNSTDGSIDLMPSGVLATHFGMRMDATSWGFGPSLLAVRASDNNLTAGAFRFMNACVLNNDVAFAFGSSQASQIRHTSTGLDTLQCSVTCNNASYSGAFAILQAGTQGGANRSPVTVHTNPNLYVYAAGSTAASFIRTEHDNTDGRIATGSGKISLDPTTSVFVNGGLQLKLTESAVSLTAATADNIIGITSTASARTVTLPTAALGAGKTYIIKDQSGAAGTNNITVNTTSAQTINGAATYVINTNYGSVQVYSNGSNWFTC